MASKKSNTTKQKTEDVSPEELTTAGMGANDIQRLAAVVGGGALLLFYLRKVTLADALLVAAGGSLIYRGINQGPLNVNLNIAEGAKRLREEIEGLTDRARDWAQGVRSQLEERFTSTGETEPIQVEQSIIINKSPEALYSFWRNFENLPQVMSYLESVTPTRGKRSHWVAKGPGGVPIEWDAEITADKKNEMISWRALDNADVPNEGSVYFVKAAEGQTELRVSMEYILPGGEIGAAIAGFFGEEPSQKIEEDLNTFKAAVEGGEIDLDIDRFQQRTAEGGA
ncbi:MAG: SRPBCC family protein [Nitrospirae bacterium]|nr:SRPBCC family protein [Candidatus Manganitrophaceae bacterium]